MRRLLASLAISAACLSGQATSQSAKALLTAEQDFESARTEYMEELSGYLPDGYRQRFAGLSQDDLLTIARTRRLWEWYIAEGPFTMGDPRKQKTGIFRQEFLDPMERVGELLLIDPEKDLPPSIRKLRSKAIKFGEKLHKVREKAGIELDPTAVQRAPTGIPYPFLDKPHSCVDKLLLDESTMVLAKTVAHPDAERVLLQNATACSQLDLMEADCVMYANRIRMLSGSIAWVADPLMTACARDHSHDRKNGDASGHQSKLPGKKFPGDRAKRFGCRNGPEGAGGGRTGRDAIRGFAYNGTGHGGPLFARLRNVVAPGCRQGALTAMYQTDNALKHACQASENELVLPPGVTSRSLKSSKLRSAVKAMAGGAYAKAAHALEGRKPEDAFEKAVHEYLLCRVQAEVEWQLEGIERIIHVGDVHEAHVRLKDALDSLGGIASFDKRANRLKSQLSQSRVLEEIKIGRRYDRLISGGRIDRPGLQKLIEEFPHSAYTGAAKHYLEAGDGGFFPQLFFFVLRDTHINKWSYLQKARVGGR